MNTPGAQLAAMRRFTERTCEICGAKFMGRKTTTACPKHQALARKRKQLAKRREEMKNLLDTLKKPPVVAYHEGGKLFAGDEREFVEGWYIFIPGVDAYLIELDTTNAPN